MKSKIKLKKQRCDNREETKEYVKSKKQSDLNFKLACNLRSRTSSAFKSQNVRRTSKTFFLLGCSQSIFKFLDHSSIVWQYDGRKLC